MNARERQKLNRPLIVAVIVAAVLLAAAVLFVAEPWAVSGKHAQVSSKAALQDYTWEELSAISHEVSLSENEQEAFGVAARYGLCDSDGTLSEDQAKTFTLVNGKTVRAQLAGVYHDELTSGGRAGLSFVFADVPALHSMNHAFEHADGTDSDSVGGWAASDMRAWLNGSFYYSLPQDLRSVLASVQKRSTNAAGSRAESVSVGRMKGSAADWTGTTSDKLWLLSVAEVCGGVDVNESLDIDESMVSVYAAEGEQYRLFAQQQAHALTACPGLVRQAAGDGEASEPCTWWLRTKTLEFGEGFWLVGTDGTVLDGLGEDASALDEDAELDTSALWGPDHARGVIAGFCL